MKPEAGKYFVLRTWSYTNKRQLWKVLSRRMMSFNSAESWAEFEADSAPKGQEVFVVRVVDRNDDEVAMSKRIEESWHDGYNTAIKSVLEGRHCKNGIAPYVPLQTDKK
jgi:hypothetical protein